jgi:hypothetical protein
MSMNQNELKFEYGEMGSGKFFVPVRIDGNQIDFFFDTGATFTGLKNIELLKDRRIVGEHKFQSASGVALLAKQCKVSEISLNGYTKKDTEVSIFPENFQHSTTLGIDFFQNIKFSFLSRSRILSINDENLPLSDNFHLTDKKHIALDFLLKDESYTCIWDTGAELTVVSKNIREAHSECFENPIEINNGSDSTGEKVEFILWDMKSFEIGNTTFNNQKVIEMDFTALRSFFPKTTEMILGFNSIVVADWTFDMEKKKYGADII